MSEINVNSIDKESGSTLTLGGAGTTVAVHASATTSGFDSGLASVQTFTSSGTWTKPSGIRLVMVEVQGAGSSGIRASAIAGRYAGGGGGGYARKVIDVSSISTATITVGTGGAATNSTTTSNAGGSSIWSDGTNTVTGGGAPSFTNSNDYVTGAGGTGSGGDLNVSGQAGGGYAGALKGGASFLGSGGSAIVPNGGAQTNVGILGGGGCGHSDGTNTSTSYSGAGAVGIVIVTEYK